MKTWKNVQSTEKPKTVEVIGDVYFVRKDIQMVEAKQKEDPNMYEYMEAQMTQEEFMVYNLERTESIQDDITTVMSALSDLYELL